MLLHFFGRAPLATAIRVGIFFVAAGPACSSPSKAPTAPLTATCADAGGEITGPADMHCQGMPVQAVSEASCFVDAGGDAGAADDTCPYGATMFGQEGDDDDCKYQVAWTSTPICEGNLGVTFTVTVTNLTTLLPVTDVPAGEGLIAEVFTTSPPEAGCDNMSTHPSPGGTPLFQTTSTSGVYTGRVVFDVPGEWTVRFHIHEECVDLLPDSPHGHAAFFVHVP